MTAMLDAMRAFVAANLDIGAARRVADLGRRLRGSTGAPRASWMAPTRLHLTLRFLGDIDVAISPGPRTAAPGKSTTPRVGGGRGGAPLRASPPGFLGGRKGG